MAALTIIMGETVNSDNVSPFTISQQMGEAGFNQLAVKLSLASLSHKELVESVSVSDAFGSKYLAYCRTEKGTQWMLDNERQFRLRWEGTSEDVPAQPEITDEDLPF
jgi:hypothetical protein